MRETQYMLANLKNFSLMRDKEVDWIQIFKVLKIQKIEFLPDLIKYRLEYFKFSKVIDYSMILYTDTRPIALMPIYLTQYKNKSIKFAPKNLIAPIFESNNKKKRFQIYSQYLELIYNIKKKHKIKKISFDIDCHYQEDVEFMSFLLENKYKIESSKTIILTQIDKLNSKNNKDYRRSYRSLINSNIHNYNIYLIDNNNFDKNVWDTFKKMHLKVSGKQTRSDETWRIQQEAILNKSAILICIKKDENFLGFAFFFLTKTNALYSSAAYDIEQNKKIPIGHLIQDFAISYFSNNGILNYYIGFEDNEKINPIQKDKNLTLFKKGFANKYSVLLTLSKKL